MSLLEPSGHHPDGHFHGSSHASHPLVGWLQLPSELYQWRGKPQEVLGLGEITGRIHAGNKSPMPAFQLERIIHVKTSGLG